MMSENRYETAGGVADKTEKPGRVHRVGTITCGLMFVLYGVLFLLHIVIPDLNYKIIFELWPLLLVSLGLEILASCTRKNQEERKIIYDFPAVLLIMLLVLFVIIMAAADYGMNVTRRWSEAHFFDYSSSHFDWYSAEEYDGKSRVQGTVYLTENDAGLQTVTAERETDITVTGYIGVEEGAVRLLYKAADGTEILIADGESSFHKTVTIPAGEGNLCFAGYGEEAVCDFDLEILWGEGISLEQETMESIESIEEAEMELSEAELPQLPEIPEPDSITAPDAPVSPVTDNWPESIRCDSEGMYAGLYKIPLSIDKPMEISLSCITEDGSINLWIEDASGNKCFDEEDMQTGDYDITIDKAGNYTVYFQAEYYYGSFEIVPVPPVL